MGKHCCAEKADTHLSNHESLCLAVVRENGAHVVVFDAAGAPKTFKYNGDIRQLCFDTHGNEIADDLLTPCFDHNGNHGDPDEDCFCGIDTPHLHAHLRNPKTCIQNSAGKGEAEIAFLASQILHVDNEDNPVVQIGISDRMPRECNSAKVQAANKEGYHRLHKVQHEDHEDYLVHNSKTGHLHLQHPSCDHCGKDDVHGSFHPMGQRRLKRHDKTDIQLHFFQVAQRPFSILEFIHSAFNVDSDRVAVATEVVPPLVGSPEKKKVNRTASPNENSPSDTPTLVSSTLRCSEICCASECPIIQKILSPVPGVKEVLINVPIKQVIVKHYAETVSANDLQKLLDKESMGATVVRDGGIGISRVSVGRSQFFVAHICCASEIPAIRNIVEPMEGVKSLSINTVSKMIYVDHDTTIVAAATICEALNEEKFGAETRLDAAVATTKSAVSTFVKSILTLETKMDPDTHVITDFMRKFDSVQIESFDLNVPEQHVSVFHNPFFLTSMDLVDVLHKETGLVASVTVDGAHPDNWNLHNLASDSSPDAVQEDQVPTYPKPTVLLSGICWIISMLHYVGGNWEYLKYVGLASVVFGLPPIAVKACKTLKRLQFDTNCLMFFASLGAVALQEYAEAAAVVFLFAISEWLEVRATMRARNALSAIVNLRPDKAYLVQPSTNELVLIPATAVPLGARVCVRTGDKIPCDGIVVEGNSTVDESSLTGESRPIRKGPNDKVSGGTANSGLSQLIVKTTATSENSAVSRLIRLVEEAQANRSETEKLVDEFARWYTPLIVLAAVLMSSIPWIFSSELGREWTFNGLILIVVACPCSMIISTPVSYVAGLAAAAQKGVLIKGGATLEALGATTDICFDKTGTLTNGEFALLHFCVVPKTLDRHRILQYMSLLEERASHPVAQALVAAARNEQVVVPRDMILNHHRIIAGEGVEGVVNDKQVHIGNERLFDRLGLLASVDKKIRDEVEVWKNLGGTVGYMSVEGHGIVCAYCAADGVREESARVVSTLMTKKKITIAMVTGDNADAALAVGKQVGLRPHQIKSKLLPEEKLNYVMGLSSSHGQSTNRPVLLACGAKRITIMCGDGVNDAPALAAADIGVAMGAGAALAMESADVTLLDSNLEKLEYSIDIGKRVIRKIQQNIVFSLVVKFLVLGFALAGKTHLWAAIGSDVGAMILVTLNSMSLLPGRRSPSAPFKKNDIEGGPLVRSKLVLPTAECEIAQNETGCHSECNTGCRTECHTKRNTKNKNTCQSAISQQSECHTGCCSNGSKCA